MKNEFEILIRKKIPFISELAFAFLAACFLIMCVLYFIMLPVRNAPGEIVVLYFIKLVPETFKKLSAFAALGLCIMIPIYSILRLHKPATLIIEEDNILIKGKKTNIAIPKKTIRKIFISDLKNLLRQSKEKTQVGIRIKRKMMVFRLKNYYETEAFIEAISIINTQFAFYDDDILTTHDDKE